jgi:hypothetical protein
MARDGAKWRVVMRIMNRSVRSSENHGITSLRHTLGALVGVILPLTLPAVLAGCGLIGGATSEAAAPTLTLLPSSALATPTPNPKTAVQQTVVQFCQALSDSKLDQAYALLTAGYQQRARSAANLPNVLEASWGPTTGCAEFGNGGFIQVSGDHASDSVLFTVNTRSFGTKQINSSLSLAQSGGAWRIDSNT